MRFKHLFLYGLIFNFSLLISKYYTLKVDSYIETIRLVSSEIFELLWEFLPSFGKVLFVK